MLRLEGEHLGMLAVEVADKWEKLGGVHAEASDSSRPFL